MDACDYEQYAQYEAVRDKAVEIIEEFYPCGADFKGLEHQIELLSCYDLDEVMDVLTAYKDASSSGAAYPPHPTKWIPDEDATAEDLIHDRKTILNLPPEVISVLSHAVGRLEDTGLGFFHAVRLAYNFPQSDVCRRTISSKVYTAHICTTTRPEQFTGLRINPSVTGLDYCHETMNYCEAIQF